MFNYEKKNDLSMILDLGWSIADVCSKVLGGILVFFPSYSMMTKYHEIWVSY